MEMMTQKQRSYIVRLEPAMADKLDNTTKRDASIIIAKLVRANKHRAKAKAKAIAKATATQKFSHGFNVGDILYASWGYEQTNLDFFKVVKATEKSIRVVEVSMDTTLDKYLPHGMARDVAFDPKTAKTIKDSFWIKDQEKGDLLRVGSYEYNNQKNYYVRVKGRYSLNHYNGQKLYESWYA